MKKIIAISIIALSLLILPKIVLAQSKQQGQETQPRVQESMPDEDETVIAPQGNQVKNQKLIKTQNQGEDQQLQVENTQEQESLQAKKDKGLGSQNRSETARQNMSLIAQKVEELLASKEDQGGIGQQVKVIAQQQKQAQQEIKGQLDKLESRKGLMKKLFGPDRKAIKNLNRQMEQNQLRIEQLQQQQTEVVNQADQTQIEEAVQALVEQNTALQDQVRFEEQIGSLFGWLAKLLAK